MGTANCDCPLRLKILHITPSYKPAWVYGGPTLSVSRLCESEAQAGADVTVYTTTANGKEELDVADGEPQVVDGASVVYFPRWTGDHTHFSPTLLWRVWRDCRKYDVVHVHSWWNLVAVLSVLMCRLRGVRPILSLRGMLSLYSFEHQNSLKKKLIHRILGKWLLSKTILHATTPQEAAEGRAIIPDWPFFIAPNIIELPGESEGEMKNEDEPVFRMVYLARIHPIKNFELLFQSLEQVEFPWQLQIIGEGEVGYVARLKELASRLGVGDRIHWLGWAGGDEKYDYLRQADLFVLTSQSENFANAVLEALAVGTPVLVSDRVGLSDYVREKDLGWVCKLPEDHHREKSNPETPISPSGAGGDPENPKPDDIRDKLEEAWRDGEKRKRIRKQAPRVVREDFDARRVARAYLEGYGKRVGALAR